MKRAISLQIDGQSMFAMLHQPEHHKPVAVLILVGGHQYRVGSHRQFIQLSRHLYEHQIISARLDYLGMGDSQGRFTDYNNRDQEISSAVDMLYKQIPELQGVVIWGLCDAATSALSYAQSDPRIKGLVLLNPWLRDFEDMGEHVYRNYYLKRLFSLGFWKKLLSGRIKVFGAVTGAIENTRTAEQSQNQEQSPAQQAHLVLNSLAIPMQIILSSEDLTAQDFKQQVLHGDTLKTIKRNSGEVSMIEGADHTLSDSRLKQQAERITQQFVDKLGQRVGEHEG